MKLKQLKINKYRNVKTVIDGIKFDSKKEASRYQQLRFLEKNSHICQLHTQFEFVLIPAQKGGIRNERPLKYIADFVYYDLEKKQTIIEDVKGKRTAQYVIKRKLMKQLGHEITEV